MNTFAKTLSTASNIVQGENGANKLASSGSPRIDAFTLLLQDATDINVRTSIDAILHESIANGVIHENQVIHDLFILAFHKRATSKKNSEGVLISDGEGFKNLFYLYILELYDEFPATIISLAKSGIFALYGYWKDYLNIWEKINELVISNEAKFIKYNPLIEAFRYAILNQRTKDLISAKKFIAEHKDYKNELYSKDIAKLGISYVGKFCVRESSSMNQTCSWFIRQSDDSLTIESHISYMLRFMIFQTVNGNKVPFSKSQSVPFGAKKIWRKDNVILNNMLDVPEVKFCSGNWSEINIGHIPSVCLHRNTKALLNEQLKIPTEEETGNRFPDNTDRVACRTNFIDHITNGDSINASALLPHQIAHIFSSGPSSINKLITEAKWKSLMDDVREKMDMVSKKLGANGTATGHMICCCDTSGSMDLGVKSAPNRPIDIAVALTAFCSQLAAEPYRDLIITFDAQPSIVNLKDSGNYSLPLQERLECIRRSGQAYNTNYIGLHQTLIKLCKDNAVPINELPVLVIFTDGEFDQMVEMEPGKSFATTHDNVERMWVNAGYSGVPTICYWNLTDNGNGVQTEADRKGVFFLQGPSPSNIKYIIHGETAEDIQTEIVVDGKISSITTKNVDPMMIFRKVMDQDYFAPIRHILSKSNELRYEMAS
jgi:hypothetical protein